MSSTSSETRYDFNLHVDLPTGGQSDASFTLWADGGVTDEIALYLFQAIVGAPWPAGAEKQFGLMKTDIAQTTYVPDMAANPPAFT